MSEVMDVQAAVAGWLLTHGVRILLILVLAVVADQVLIRAIRRLAPIALGRNRVVRDPEELRARIDTIVHVLTRTVSLVILVLVGAMVLSELGIDVGPLIAGAGVVGIAIGFGAQSIVRDLLAGIFILFEGQYSRGDIVKLSGIGYSISGEVELVNLRRTVLRDLDGAQHTVANGAIIAATNMTADVSRVNLDFVVPLDMDLDRARQLFDEVGRQLADHPMWAPVITDPPHYFRINGISEAGVDLKVLGETLPGRHWEVAGEYRRMVRERFEREGLPLYGGSKTDATTTNGQT